KDQLAAKNVLQYSGVSGLLPDGHTIRTYSKTDEPTITFEHAWLAVTITAASESETFELDPSWKYKDLQPGIWGNHGLIVKWDDHEQEKYLQYLKTPPNSPAPSSSSPYEFYEDEVAAQLRRDPSTTTKTLADVPYDGPIIAKHFQELPTTGELPFVP